MSKVTVLTTQGYGTERNPQIGGTENVVDQPVEIPVKHFPRGLVEYDFEPDETGSKQVSNNLYPLLRIEEVNHLNGKFKTLIEATFVDKEQRKAMKDTFEDALFKWYFAQVDSVAEILRIAESQ